MPSHYLSFVWFRAIAQLKSESSRAYLGYLWWVLEPLLYLMVFYIVFSVVLNRGDANYISILLCGLVVWKWFDSSIRSSMDVINQNAGLIDKVYIPKTVFPAICVVGQGVKFFFVFFLLLLFLGIGDAGISFKWLWLPVLLLVQFLLVLSFSFCVAAVTPFVPDIKMLFDKMMTFMFFLSGIFYTSEVIPEDYLLYFRLNPMFSLIEQFRLVLVFQQHPNLLTLLFLTALSCITLGIGYFMLKRFDRRYPRMIY